jgi:hypothetical protein
VQRQEIRRQANCSELVTRILRHEVVNAATIADRYAGTLDGDGDDGSVDGTAVAAIREAATRIVDTVEDVGDITDDRVLAPVDVGDAVLDAVTDVDAASRGVAVDAAVTPGVVALADDRLEVLLAELVRNAVENQASTVEVATRNERTAA